VAVVLLAVVLVPFALWGETIDARAAEWLRGDQGVGAAVFGLLAADVALPVPSSVVAVTAGWRLGLISGAFVVWAGLQTGCLAAWLVGRFVGDPLLDRWVGPAEQRRARAWLGRRGGLLFLAASRPVPVMAEASVLLAGSVRMPLPAYLAATALANAGLAAWYAAAGALAADGAVSLAVVGAVALPAVGMVVFPALFEG
jgi:uncharacterized membrane protein YdjX (TVP38/TMEM64 family)